MPDEIGVVTSLVEAASMAAEGVTYRKESGALLALLYVVEQRLETLLQHAEALQHVEAMRPAEVATAPVDDEPE